jgi:general secretion pathway protein M
MAVDLRERWEQMAPRERRLVTALGVTAVVCVFAFVGLQIKDGLDAIGEKNASTREALRKLDRYALTQAEGKADESQQAAVIGDAATPLASYTEGIANELGLTIPESTERPAVVKGKYRELALDVKLRGVSLEQLAQFMKRIETRQPAVVTTRVFVRPYVSAHEKLDAELTVVTWEKAKVDKKKDGGKGGDKAGEENAGGEKRGS